MQTAANNLQKPLSTEIEIQLSLEAKNHKTRPTWWLGERLEWLNEPATNQVWVDSAKLTHTRPIFKTMNRIWKT